MNTITEKLKSFNFINISKDEKATISTNIHNMTSKQRDDLTSTGIDIDSMLMNVQEDEMYQSISKIIIHQISNLSTKTTDINIDAIISEQKRDDKITEIFDEEKVERPIYSNRQGVQSILRDNLNSLCDKIDPNVIITNGNVGAGMQDLFEFKSIVKSNKIMMVSNPHYLIGSIFGCDVYVDAYMRYNDNRVFIGNVDLEFTHNDKLKFNKDFTKLTYGYDIKLNPNSKVEVLNIIDSDMHMF